MDQLANGLSELLKQAAGSSFSASLLAVALAYVGGILSSLTPCIYPMIPITIGVVGGIDGDHRKKSEVFIRGLAYVAGMAIIYAFLGVLAGLTGRVFGSFTNTPLWYLILGTIMTLAALMMVDVIQFDPQAFIQSIQRKISGKATVHVTKHDSSLFGAFTLGASSGFIAAPCTTPVLTAILGFIAQTQSVFLGLVLMLSFSLGLGTLLVLIAYFAGILGRLPKAGNWMNRIKIASGILILIFADYLFYKAGAAQ